MDKVLKIMVVGICLFMLVGCEGNVGQETKTGDDIDDIEHPVEDEQDGYTVTFMTDGGTSISSQVVESGDSIAYPDDPQKDGYIFIQWHTSSNLDAPFNRTTPVDSDLDLYAEWEKVSEDDVTITFESEYGNAVSPIIGKAGDAINAPSTPSDIFYNFLAWKIKGTNDVFDTFDVMPEESMTLVAVWEKNDTYEMTFYINDTTEYERILFTSGSTINLPEEPQVDEYVFTGWYEDANFRNEFDETSPLPSQHISLYGQLIAVEDYFYVVTFETDGGTLLDATFAVVGESFNEPVVPRKKGYIFDGWYEENSYQTLYDFDQVQHEDLTLYAKWTFDDTYTITNLVVSEDEVIEIILAQKEVYYLPQMFRDGYIFDWWYVTENYNVRYREYLYFAEPLGYVLNLHAKWIEAPSVVYVTLETNGGTEARYTEGGGVIETGIIQANPGSQINIYRPTRDGYDFGGWYQDEQLATPITPISYGTSSLTISIPDEDTTLYAKWVSKTTGEVDDGSDTTDLSLLEKLDEFGFVCNDSTCVLEAYQDYDYIFDLDTHTLSYVIDVEEMNEDGYRNYDRLLTIDPNYDIYYSYEVEEDFGYFYYVEISIVGNYLSNTYEVTHFRSNVTQEQTNYDKAMRFIENIVKMYEGLTK